MLVYHNIIYSIFLYEKLNMKWIESKNSFAHLTKLKRQKFEIFYITLKIYILFDFFIFKAEHGSEESGNHTESDSTDLSSSGCNKNHLLRSDNEKATNSGSTTCQGIHFHLKTNGFFQDLWIVLFRQKALLFPQVYFKIKKNKYNVL